MKSGNNGAVVARRSSHHPIHLSLSSLLRLSRQQHSCRRRRRSCGSTGERIQVLGALTRPHPSARVRRPRLLRSLILVVFSSPWVAVASACAAPAESLTPPSPRRAALLEQGGKEGPRTGGYGASISSKEITFSIRQAPIPMRDEACLQMYATSSDPWLAVARWR